MGSRIQSFFPVQEPVSDPTGSTASRSLSTSTAPEPRPATKSDDEEPTQLDLQEAIKVLEARLRAKKNGLQVGHSTLLRYRAVLIFMNFQLSTPAIVPRNEASMKPTRLDYALLTAKSFRRGVYLARKIVSWECQWRKHQTIDESKHGCHVKTRSWFNDEGVQLAAREFVRDAKDGRTVTAFKLAQAISTYLDSKRAKGILEEVFQPEPETEDGNQRSSQRITARTARNWLQRMGFKHSRIQKGVYFDGHEREDVIKYRDEVFVPKWMEFRRRMVQFKEDGSWVLPDGCYKGDDGNYYMKDTGLRPIVLVTHDESTFNANDGKRSGWFKVGDDGKIQYPILPKGRGKGIMVSMFLTPGGILRVPDTKTDAQLLQRNPNWPKAPSPDGTLLREAIQYLEYGKDNYWTGDKMVDQTINEALPIFREAFPKFEALFAFDNAANHNSYAPDALVVNNMNLEPGGKKPTMMDTHYRRADGTIECQSMVFPPNYPDFSLRGKPKGIKRILKERCLWPENGKNALGYTFRLDCPKSHGRGGCLSTEDVLEQPELARLVGKCCARTVLANQPDFLNQKGRLEQELTDRSQSFIFYPKFHCEVNFIERFWAAAKFHTRENCSYDLISLRQTLPEALKMLPRASILKFYGHCDRIIEAYADPQRFSYGTKEFQERVYKGHRQVVDKTKW